MTILRSMGAAAVLAMAACTASLRPNAAMETAMASADAHPQPSRVDRDTAVARRATAAFRSLDAAEAAGYPRSVPRCLGNPQHGGMGYHHLNRTLLDGRVQLDRPEILLYSRAGNGEYTLNGVEYIVPFSAHPRAARPPRVMGMELKPSEELQLWYLHVWLWTPNPAGLTADWNPAVKC